MGELSIGVDAVMQHLHKEMLIKDAVKQVIYGQIIHRAAHEHQLQVSPEEVQQEADRFRYQHRLESASATFSWLEDQLISPDDWESGIRDTLLKHKLAAALFGAKAEAYFRQNKVQYEQAVLYRLLVPYQTLAQELFYEIEEEEISFLEAAHLYDVDERRRLTCGFEGKVSRWALPPDLAARVFAAQAGEVLGPLQAPQGYELLLVESFIAPELNAETRQQIVAMLFQEWLDSELNYLIHTSPSQPG